MSNAIVKMQFRATVTESKGVEDTNQSDYLPLFSETRGARQEDSFFRVSPAIAAGDGYSRHALKLSGFTPEKDK